MGEMIGLNGSNGKYVYAHHLPGQDGHGEYIVAVGVPFKEASRRQVSVQPRPLVKTPQQFVDDFVKELIEKHGRDAVKSAHETTPNALWVGSPKNGLYVSVKELYGSQLEGVIDEVNRI
ncbi:hypothetical protein J4448_04530 [Candidatus Woesearchaeota archaeon]|nr:hypothetical protein [Candidatus Woesearchaeota archaeon]